MEKELSDIELVINVQKDNCNNSLKVLIEKHAPLCYEIHRKYSSAMSNSGVCPEDVLGDKDYLIYKSALSFKAQKKTKFSTWLGNQMRYLCLNSMNRNRLLAVEESKITFFLNKNIDDSEQKAKEHSDFVFNILNQLKDKRIKRIFRMRYFYDKKSQSAWSQIADLLGVSTQTAINLHNRAIEILRCKMSEKSMVNLDKI